MRHSALQGDPFDVGQGVSVYRSGDVAIRGSTMMTLFDRFFSSHFDGWAWGCNGPHSGAVGCPLPSDAPASYLPRPFGRFPDHNIRWWHGLYSFVLNVNPNQRDVYVLRPTDGRSPVIFNRCTFDGGSCYASLATHDRGARWKLLHVAPDAGVPEHFVAADERHRRYTYAADWVASDPNFAGDKRFFLTRIEGETYDGGLISLNYGVPLDGGCYNGGTSSVSGTPYLSSFSNEDGVTVRVEYKQIPTWQPYTQLPNGECVISRLIVDDWLPDAGPTTTPLATYTYYFDGGTEQAGLLSAVTWHHPSDGAQDRTESYNYADAGPVFEVSEAAIVLSQHTFDVNGMTITDTTPDESLTAAYSGAAIGSNICSGTTSPSGRSVTATGAGAGDGTSSTVTWSRRFDVFDSTVSTMNAYAGVLVGRYEDDGGTSDAVSRGTVVNDVVCSTSPANPTYIRGVQDKRGHWTTALNVDAGAGGLGPGVYLPAERVQTTSGATASDGTDALEVRNYTYTYGGSGQAERMYEQMVETESRPSVYAPSGGNVVTRYVYDGRTNRVKAVIRSGWTAEFNGGAGTWSKPQKHLATFYFTNTVCSGSGTEDPLGRVREVHGPCWVSSDTATDCGSGSIPVTQYAYYSSTATNHKANRLSSVTRFPSATTSSCSGGLTTTYDAYDYQGNVLQETDPNGVVTTRTYALSELTSSSTAGATTSFGYEKGKRIWRREPEGNYEVYCYRSGTSGGCSGGTWTDKLQWKAKAGNSTATSYSERVDYVYWQDGTVKRETYSTGSGEIRRMRTFAADAHRRPTWSGWGRASSSDPPPAEFDSVRSFDGANNVSGIGLPYNGPLAFCGGGVFDKRCAKLAWDRANRLSELDEYPTTSSSDVRTCIGHDAHGNTTKVIAGLGSTDTCLGSDGLINSSLPQTMAQSYAFDDFGNLVEVQLPWTGASGGGTTRFQYNALGNEVVKQTPSMASTSYYESEYDQLGRLTAKSSETASSSTTLFTLQYDTGQPDISCPQTANTAGRLVKRTDSFGATWYAYDAWGRVTKEIRVRAGASTCSASGDNNPHTTYTYSSNGNLTSVTYPHGRTVTYNYWSSSGGAEEDRVASISISTFLADAGTSTLTPVSSVTWEPYGRLRGYQVNHPTTGTTAIEYMQGDYASTAPSNGAECPSSPPATGTGSDYTGRLRALRLSSGAFDAGVSSGDIYKRTYTWTADQVARTDTCVLDGGVRTESYQYDQLLRLTSATGSGDAGGPYATRTYGYDARSNRLADGGLTEDGLGTLLSYGASSLSDRLTQASSWADSQTLSTYTYDSEGRVTEKATGAFIDGSSVNELAFAYGPDGNVPTESVFKSVTVNGASYSYYFDALGRRRLKVYPLGPSDEYFHDVSSQLLSDRGNKNIGDTSWHTEDDYVWLDGRPLVVIRGRLASDYTRQADSTADCTRNGDLAACGFYFPVTDHIGKPVLMLDSSAKVAGVGEYDPFGHVNRAVVYSGSAHPYGNSLSGSVVADFTQPVGASMSLDMRVLIPVLETEKKSPPTYDRVWIEGNRSRGSGPHMARMSA